MYEQIARNKRRSVLYVGLFIVVWLGAGALVGWLAAVSGNVDAPVGNDVVLGITVAAMIAALGIVVSFLSGQRLILAVTGAHEADPVQYAQLRHLVEALALGDGVPTPAVYVIDDPSPNAFATGFSPAHASITVTTGLLTLMDREELEGVIGHELSHIKNYDTRLLLIVTTLVGMAGLIASILWRNALLIRGRGRDGGQFTVIVIAAGLVFGAIAVLFGPLIRLALSRRRESLADASSVELTRNPVGLLRALRALQADEQPLARTNHATAAMFINNPLHGREGFYSHLFDTHPPLEERIAVLEGMAHGLTV